MTQIEENKWISDQVGMSVGNKDYKRALFKKQIEVKSKRQKMQKIAKNPLEEQKNTALTNKGVDPRNRSIILKRKASDP